MAKHAEVVFHQWVVYDNPADFPGQYALRRWNLNVPDPQPIAVSHDLAAVLARVPRGATFIGRQPNDDPVIWGVFL